MSNIPLIDISTPVKSPPLVDIRTPIFILIDESCLNYSEEEDTSTPVRRTPRRRLQFTPYGDEEQIRKAKVAKKCEELGKALSMVGHPQEDILDATLNRHWGNMYLEYERAKEIESISGQLDVANARIKELESQLAAVNSSISPVIQPATLQPASLLPNGNPVPLWSYNQMNIHDVILDRGPINTPKVKVEEEEEHEVITIL